MLQWLFPDYCGIFHNLAVILWLLANFERYIYGCFLPHKFLAIVCWVTGCVLVYYLESNKNDVEELHKQLPGKPPSLGVAPLLEGVHEVELQRSLHLFDLHVLHVGTAASWVHLLLLTRDVHARAEGEVEEVAACWCNGGRGRGRGGEG